MLIFAHIFFSKASGTIVKATGISIYLGFFDTETNREEFAVYTFDNEIDDRENIPVLFDAYQMDPRYPVYCDDIFVTWIVTKLEFKIIDSSEKVVATAKGDPFKLGSRYENKYLLSFDLVPTFYTGRMEFYGYFKHWEDDFKRFKQNLQVRFTNLFIYKLDQIGPNWIKQEFLPI